MGKIAILILAAGNASRMGKIKQLLSYKNSTLLGYAVEEALLTSADAVYAVLGANSKTIRTEIKANIKWIFNADWQLGMGTSISKGISVIAEAGYEGVLIMLADQPKIDHLFLNALMAEEAKNPAAIIASDYGNKNGVPAFFPKLYFDQLKKLNTDQGARELLNGGSIEVIGVPAKEYIEDIDTPADYKRLLKN